ncbi:hypothetical protein ACSSS7_000229 [Eimeria intestinalis]
MRPPLVAATLAAVAFAAAAAAAAAAPQSTRRFVAAAAAAASHAAAATPAAAVLLQVSNCLVFVHLRTSSIRLIRLGQQQLAAAAKRQPAAAAAAAAAAAVLLLLHVPKGSRQQMTRSCSRLKPRHIIIDSRAAATAAAAVALVLILLLQQKTERLRRPSVRFWAWAELARGAPTGGPDLAVAAAAAAGAPCSGAVDVHPTEPLLLCGLYDGHLKICSFSSLQQLADIDVSPLPLRAAAFVARRDWVVCAGDDCAIRCFSINTQEKINEVLNAHKDYIRHIQIHPTRGLALSSSDDMTGLGFVLWVRGCCDQIKLWDMDQDWLRLCSFEAHAHYVMQTAWHPRDSTVFASCSLDRSIKVWGIGSAASGSKAAAASNACVTTAHFTLLGHERGVNAIAYSSSGERPYLVSGADDATVRVWDYQTKQCVQVLRGHSKNVCSVTFGGCSPHALPVLFSGGEDGRLCIWNALTYKEEASLDLGLDRIWALALRPRGDGTDGGAAAGFGGMVIAVGSDAGTLVLKMGKEGPVVSSHGGKAVLARGFDLLQLNLKMLDESFADGEKIQCPTKEIGRSGTRRLLKP